MNNGKYYQKINNGTIYKNLYTIDRFFKKGGMDSEIYLGHCLSNCSEKIIIKVIYKPIDCQPEYWQNIINESITNQRLSGKPNIIKTIESWNEGDKIFIIMEYVEGVSLKQYLHENGPFLPKIALCYFLKILFGVKAMHDLKHQIIHRDLKPENMIINTDLNQITIIDFGISSVIEKKYSHLLHKDEVKIYTNETKNEIYGTYSYLLPDIIDKNQFNYDSYAAYQAGLTTQFDFFSLGIILYEMVMGKQPFHLENGEKEENILLKPLKYDMPCISSINKTIPKALENIIFRCIACKKEDKKYRYTTIDQIIADCNILLDNWDNDHQQLIKQIHNRVLQDYQIFNLNKIKMHQYFYQHWYFFVIMICFLVVCIFALIYITKR